jgi:hypothetical protein
MVAAKPAGELNVDLSSYPGHLILLHPNIPKPLHGLTPRDLLGKEWWDVRRQQAYARFNYQCWACGVHKSKARYHSWLEGHECYVINYQEATASYIGVSALCHCCHNYIHDGRLYALHQGHRLARTRYSAIISHGNRVLSKNGIAFQKRVCQPIMVPLVDNPFIESTLNANISQPIWSDWRLIIGQRTFKPKFKNEQAWQRHYGR